MGVHTSVTAQHTGTQHGNLIPQIYSLIPTIPKNLLPKSSPPHPLSHILRKSSHRFNRFNKTNRNGMSLVAPPIDLPTYYSLTCWHVDLLTFNKKSVKKSPTAMKWWVGDDVAAHESVVGIRELWCGDSFMYLIPSAQSVNYERGCVLLLRFRLIMA